MDREERIKKIENVLRCGYIKVVAAQKIDNALFPDEKEDKAELPKELPMKILEAKDLLINKAINDIIRYLRFKDKQ